MSNREESNSKRNIDTDKFPLTYQISPFFKRRVKDSVQYHNIDVLSNGETSSQKRRLRVILNNPKSPDTQTILAYDKLGGDNPNWFYLINNLSDRQMIIVDPNFENYRYMDKSGKGIRGKCANVSLIDPHLADIVDFIKYLDKYCLSKEEELKNKKVTDPSLKAKEDEGR